MVTGRPVVRSMLWPTSRHSDCDVLGAKTHTAMYPRFPASWPRSLGNSERLSRAGSGGFAKTEKPSKSSSAREATLVDSRSSRAATLALSTFGWSKGLTPISAHATTVANSQRIMCSARFPEISTSDSEPAPPTESASGSPSRLVPTTGRIPFPSLPVDSATSCSTQSPSPGCEGSSR